MRIWTKHREKVAGYIKYKVLDIFVIICIVMMVSMIAITSYFNYVGVIKTLESTLMETVEATSHRVSNYFETYKVLASNIATQPLFATPLNVDKEEKLKALQEIQKRYEFLSVDLADEEGNTLLTNTSIKERVHFKKVKETKEPYIADLYVRPDTKDLIVGVCAPILVDGTFKGAIIISVDGIFLSDLATEIKVGKEGTSEIQNKEGTVIGAEDVNRVIEKWNTIEAAKENPKLNKLAAIENKRRTGEPGIEKYYEGMTAKLKAYAPIPGTDGWTVDITVREIEFTKYNTVTIMITVVVGIALLIVTVVLFKKRMDYIVEPINKVTEMAKKVAEGQYDTVLEVSSKDESGRLAESMMQMTKTTNEVISDLCKVLKALGEGDFTAKPSVAYIGVFKEVEDAMNQIAMKMTATIQRIHQSADEVLAGSSQVAKGASELALGATEQASVVEEFMTSTEEIAHNIEESVNEIHKTTEQSNVAKEKVDESKDKMLILVEAMEKITTSSRNVVEVVKVIEHIAEQTNLLALNAAIESARAGDAGRGFGVVANEIRDLANKSSETVKQIEGIIGESLRSVNEGKLLTDETVESLDEVVESVNETTLISQKLLQNSEVQKQMLQELLKGTDQISQVAESNSAHSEESAAVSEELMAQAENLKILIDQFKI